MTGRGLPCLGLFVQVKDYRNIKKESKKHKITLNITNLYDQKVHVDLLHITFNNKIKKKIGPFCQVSLRGHGGRNLKEGYLLL